MSRSFDTFTNTEGVNEELSSSSKEGFLSRAVSYGRSLVRSGVAKAAAPISIITALAPAAALLPTTGCSGCSPDTVNQSENIGTVQQAISYNFDSPIKLTASINGDFSHQYKPSIVEDGSDWILYYVSDHAGGIKAAEPYRVKIDKSLNIISGPTIVGGVNNDLTDGEFKLCEGDAYISSAMDYLSEKAYIYDDGGSPFPTSVSLIGQVPGGINSDSTSVTAFACVDGQNKLIAISNLASAFDRPHIATIGVWSWTQLNSCDDGTDDMIGAQVYNGNFVYGINTLQGDKIKIRSFDGSNCTASPDLVDGVTGVVNINGVDQNSPFMAPSGEGLFYAQRNGNGYLDLYYAPISASVCGNSVIEGAEQCDDGPSNGTPCTPAYGLSCNWCDNSCVTQTVAIQEWCDDTITNGPETCDNGPVLNGQTCVPPYGNSCNYCDDGCNTQVVPMAEYCDDNTINGPEQCDDGPVLNGQICTPSYGNSCNYCDDGCNTQVVPMAEYCDDNTINGPEQCDDGPVLNGQLCIPPYGNSCTYCTQTCTSDSVPMVEFCGDNTKNGPEGCDGSDLAGENCATQGFQAGPGLACANDCLSFNTSACTPLPSCGDNICNGTETCGSCPGDCGVCCGNNVVDNGETCDEGVNNTNVACTPPYNDTCNYCDTSCIEHTEQGATCGDGNCDNGFEDQNNCVSDCGSGGGGAGGEGGMGAGGAGAEGGMGGSGGQGGGPAECFLTLDSADGDCEITSCTTDKIAVNVNGTCTFTYIKDLNDEPTKVYCTGEWNGFDIRPDDKMLWEDAQNGEGIECNVSEGGNGANKLNISLAPEYSAHPGIVLGAVDTDYGFRYDEQYNTDPAKPHEYVTLYSTFGRVDIVLNGQPFLTLNTGEEVVIRRSDLSEFVKETIKPDVPKDEPDCGCEIVGDPLDISKDINGFVGLVMLGGVMALRRRRREEEESVE